ncbi:MAG TPA: PAC2 family protein [Actinomycetota bacterium]|nr:PAC2 family protein [Actinomycetota bacterium]
MIFTPGERQAVWEAWGVDAVTFESRPTLREPALICAFAGWNDGGESASGAARFLREAWGATRFATIDPEEFFDFQVNRPTVRLIDGVTRHIEWPRNDFFHASAGTRDVVLFTGIEPNNKWRGFCEAIVAVGREVDADTLVTLGGFLADMPHTRAIRVAGSAPTQEEAEALGVAASRYEGPTGIVGVLQDVANRAGLRALSLWAAVPHYLPAGPNPKAALALVERLGRLLEVPIDTAPLSALATTWEERVDATVAENDELSEYVRRLEAGADQAEEDELEIPSGDELARELERFLRRQGGGEGER